MVIGIFTDTYLPDVNGVATATKNLRDVLIANGNQVILVTTGLKGQKHFSFEDGIMRIPGKSLRFLYDYRMAFIYNRKAYKILKKISFDVIHVQQEFGISIFGRLCAKRFRVPLIYTYHTSYEDYFNSLSHADPFKDTFTKSTIKIIIKKIASSNAQIITPSEKTRFLLKSYGVNNYINVIPNMLSLSEFTQPKDIEREIVFRKEHHLLGKKILLYLGRLGKEKNVEELIQGFENYQKLYHDDKAVFMIIGSGPDQKSIESYVKLSECKDKILFLGQVPHSDTAFYYKLADVFVSASTSETQGLTYSEAMASKTLVLAKYDFNLADLIIDGSTGFFFDSPTSLVDRIKEILTINIDRKNQIIDEAFKRNESLFSAKSYYERIMHVYKKAQRGNF